MKAIPVELQMVPGYLRSILSIFGLPSNNGASGCGYQVSLPMSDPTF